ncbi:Thymidylate synthase ThyX [Rickettsiales endosymbiont of Paramecium tredecaurelia]|uniref:FAD-dependent thymidylate synthase n=1 Tax=Candidatus Sarmatiella mevalonica TaxID=2770581 RepID=UPI001922A4EC|nr:FAD-dependent thymidylate synthase [Candidatus Sarmatiella mevalonica]MBL3284305.1 Thymidylate synthase ThyX [Candidatus Sarmatiella mevalonica]
MTQEQPKTLTARPTVEELEKIIAQPIPILDKGFIRLVDYMGDDAAVVQAARVSYGVGTKQSSQDKALINYLMRHRHTSPFEMCEIKLHIKLPIFIARQWIRHRTASVNEYSARYSILSNEFYLPSLEQVKPQAKNNKQCSADAPLPTQEAMEVLEILKQDALRNYEHYIHMMNQDEEGNCINANRFGISRELARMNLTLNYYTQWYWKTNLRNLLHFLDLRCSPHAQYEIRVYALALMDVVKKWVPMVAQAFEEHVSNGITLSASAKELIKRIIHKQPHKEQLDNMNKKELAQITEIFGIEDLV